MKNILINFLIELNDKGLINNHDFDYEKVSRNFVNKNENKQLILQDVSNRKELLIAFHKWQQNMWTSPNAEITENVVDVFLKIMRKHDKYYWVKVSDTWIIAKWNEQHEKWHLINGRWIRDSDLQEINDNEILPPK